MSEQTRIDPTAALSQVEAADRRWATALAALEGSVTRVREFGEAAKDRAAALRLAEASGVSWSRRPGASRMQLPYELRPGSGLRHSTAPWDALDNAWANLGAALEGDELFLVAHAFDGIAIAVRSIVKALEAEGEAEAAQRRSA